MAKFIKFEENEPEWMKGYSLVKGNVLKGGGAEEGAANCGCVDANQNGVQH